MIQVEIPEPDAPLLPLAQYAKLPHHVYTCDELAQVECRKEGETIHYQWIGDESLPLAVSLELLSFPNFKFPDEWKMIPVARNEQIAVVYFRREITP